MIIWIRKSSIQTADLRSPQLRIKRLPSSLISWSRLPHGPLPLAHNRALILVFLQRLRPVMNTLLFPSPRFLIFSLLRRLVLPFMSLLLRMFDKSLIIFFSPPPELFFLKSRVFISIRIFILEIHRKNPCHSWRRIKSHIYLLSILRFFNSPNILFVHSINLRQILISVWNIQMFTNLEFAFCIKTIILNIDRWGHNVRLSDRSLWIVYDQVRHDRVILLFEDLFRFRAHCWLWLVLISRNRLKI